MSTKTKLFSAAAIFGALSSTAAIGAVNDWDDPDTTTSYSGWISSFSVEGFYGAAQEKLFKDFDIDKLDIGGLSIRYTGRMSTTSPVFPELFGITSVGGGTLDQTWYGYGYHPYFGEGSYREELNYDLFSAQFAIGANIRFQPTEKFSIFAGVRVGLDIEYVEYEYKYNSYRDQKNNTDVGFLYGIGIGADFNITKHHGITFAVDYVCSTAQPEFEKIYISGSHYTVKTEEQSYIMVSVGYKYTF